MNRMQIGGRRPVRDRRPRPYAPQPQPLLNNQLGLQDIDLELELLKRKREIIEQQQQILNNDFLPGNRFGEFSHMYEDRGSYGPGSSGGKKRPQVWDHDSPPKRYATGNNAPHKSFNPPFRAEVKKPNSQGSFQPRSSGYQPRFGNSSAAKKKDFKPNKVSKPSAAPPPNKLNSYNEADRIKLVTATMSDDSLILRPDRPASNQLNGRLELALGHLLKEIRTKFPEYEEQFTNNIGRAIKQSLRDRIRACMMGKPVTVFEDTVKTYRESFPPETDKDLLLNSLEKQTNADFVPIQSDNPHQFFTKNLGRLMNKKLEEMFQKLGEIYSPVIPPERYPSKTDNATDKNNSEIKENDDKPNNADVPVIKEETENKEVTDNTDVDKETAPNTVKEHNDETYKKIISTEEYQKLDKLMTGMLPYMLKKFTPVILKLMKLDGVYRSTFSSLKQELRKKIANNGETVMTQNKLPHLPKPIQKSDVINVEEMQKEEEEDEVQKQLYYPLPYFAKIYGRPSLPKRKAMQTFFENFKPKSIKKHRTIHNILFVGFTNKQEFEKLLAANGTVIGRNTLIIKVSERSKPTPDVSNDSQNIINDDLDEQITELLSSIKKSEGLLDENDVEMISDDSKPEVKAENDTIIDDTETKPDPIVEITDITDVETENNINDELVQQNDATKEAIEENNKEEPNTGTEDAPQEVDNDKIDTNTEKQDGIKEDIKIENNVPTTNEGKKEKEVDNITEIESEKTDAVSELKSEVKEVKGTPTRSSARLASTPSAIRTRRASKLADNS